MNITLNTLTTLAIKRIKPEEVDTINYHITYENRCGSELKESNKDQLFEDLKHYAKNDSFKEMYIEPIFVLNNVSKTLFTFVLENRDRIEIIVNPFSLRPIFSIAASHIKQLEIEEINFYEYNKFEHTLKSMDISTLYNHLDHFIDEGYVEMLDVENVYEDIIDYENDKKIQNLKRIRYVITLENRDQIQVNLKPDIKEKDPVLDTKKIEVTEERLKELLKAYHAKNNIKEKPE